MSARDKVAFLIDFSELFLSDVLCVWAESWGVFRQYLIVSVKGGMFISLTQDEWDAGKT